MAKNRQFRISASFWEATRIALDSLRKNKLRSFLTLLGIILATTTLIAVTALIRHERVHCPEKGLEHGSAATDCPHGLVRPLTLRNSSRWKRNPQIEPDEFESSAEVPPSRRSA
jgi:putative ABC transport system permease protein